MERDHSRLASGWGWFAFVGVIFLVGLEPVKVKAIDAPDGKDICQGIHDPAAQKRCRATLNTLPPASNTTGVNAIAGWHLVRTPQSAGGEAISISHLADVQKSDSNFAGMLLSCGRTGIELSMVVIEPYPPNISIELFLKLSNESASAYRGGIIPPGVMVRLPPEALTSILDRRQQSDELTVTLAYGSARSIMGVVKLAGLEQALGTLKALCGQS